MNEWMNEKRAKKDTIIITSIRSVNNLGYNPSLNPIHVLVTPRRRHTRTIAPSIVKVNQSSW